MNANRRAHYLGLLATLAAQLGGVWASTETDLAAKVALSIAAGLAVLLPSVWQRKVYPVLLALIPVAIALVAVVKLKVTTGSAAFGFLSILPAILTRLGALLPAQPEDQTATTKGPDMNKIASIIILVAAIGITACKTSPTKPDSFFGAVATCTQQNSHNDQAGQAALNCLLNAAGGDYGACLSGLVAAGYWTVDEIACVVRQYATESAQRINSGAPTPSDSVILERSNQWLRDNQVKFR